MVERLIGRANQSSSMSWHYRKMMDFNACGVSFGFNESIHLILHEFHESRSLHDHHLAIPVPRLP